MTMKEHFDVFQVHQDIIKDYRNYVRSFLNIADEDTRQFVKEKVIKERSLWPDALIQLNPAYAKTKTVAQLAQDGHLHPTTADIFRDNDGNSFHLYRHQTDAIDLALRQQPYVVTTAPAPARP